MARIRSGARQASRHSGRQYDVGFQFRNPQHAKLQFGPWEGVWPLGDRRLPRSILKSLVDGILRDGIILPVWGRSESTQANATVLGAEELPVASDVYSMIFFRNLANSNRLSVRYDNGAGDSGTDNSTVVFTASRVAVAPWGAYIYITQPGLASGALRYDVVANTFTAVGTIPDGKFMFILDNNLVVIYEDSGVWYESHSVDSLPEDFSGAGSGTNPLYGIGKVMGVGLLEDRAVIVGSRGAKVMVPTGSANPSFRLIDVMGIKGTPFEYAVASDKTKVYYIDYNRQLVSFSGGAEAREEGVGEGAINAAAHVFYSRRLESIVVSIPSLEQTLFLDPMQGKWVGNLPVGWSFLTDGPTNDVFGRVLGFSNGIGSYDQTELDLDPTTFDYPAFSLGKVDLGEEWLIETVSVIRTDTQSPPPPSMTITRTMWDNIEEETVFGDDAERTAVIKGHTIEYQVVAPALTAILEFEGQISSGPFLVDEINGAGNVPVDLTNPPSGLRGDTDASGNMDVDETSTGFVSDGELTASGNMGMETSSDLWERDKGIEGIIVMLQMMEEKNVASA